MCFMGIVNKQQHIMGDTEDIRGLVGRAAVISCLLDRIERIDTILI